MEMCTFCNLIFLNYFSYRIKKKDIKVAAVH